MTHRERVRRALAHAETDRTPLDFAAVPEIWSRLQKVLDAPCRETVLRALDVDCRVISYDSRALLRPPGTPDPEASEALQAWGRLENGQSIDVWGARRRVQRNAWGAYDELCDYPLGDAQSVSDLRKHRWPEPEWWDFERLDAYIDRANPGGEYHLRYRVGSILETAWSLRGFESFLIDLMTQPELACYIMDRIAELHAENLERVLETAGARIDMVYTYDDVAHQKGLLISKDVWRRTLAPRQKRILEIAARYDKPVMLHCCGAVRGLIGEYVDMGVSVLNPIQPRASGMNFAELKGEFGRDLTFHGGIDIQELLPNGKPEEVRREAERARSVLGEGGGYILAPAHHVQADSPLENILALYPLRRPVVP